MDRFARSVSRGFRRRPGAPMRRGMDVRGRGPFVEARRASIVDDGKLRRDGVVVLRKLTNGLTSITKSEKLGDLLNY